MFSLLALVTAITAAASTSLATRFYRRPAESFLAAAVVWSSITVGSAYVLGLSSQLTAMHLGALACAVAAGVFATTLRRPVGAGLRAVAHDTLRLALAPFEAIADALRARSAAALTGTAAIGLVAWAFLTTYYAPSWRDPDCLRYHEPIVGFAIQNHGFRIARLPAALAQIDSSPRVGELVSLWFVIFTDRRLIELGSCIAAPILVAGTHLLCRRAGAPRHVALGLASSTLLVPAALAQLQSALVDLTLGAFLVAGTHFATRTRLRAIDAMLAALALTLALGTSFHAAVPVAVLAVIVPVRLSRAELGARGWGALAAGALLLCAMGCAVYLRNYVHFHHPAWPPLAHDVSSGRGSAWSVLAELYGLPSGGSTRANYGLGFAWIALPLAVAGAIAPFASLAFSRAALLRTTSLRVAGNVALVALPAIAWAPFSPALGVARHQFFAITAVFVLVARFVAMRPRLAETALVGLLAFGLVDFVWAAPRPLVSPSTLLALARTPWPEREVRPDLGAPVTREIGLARESELAAGDIVAFGDEGARYPALLWNDHYSNRLEYVGGDDLGRRAAALGAEWVFCGHGCDAIEAPGSGWTPVGEVGPVEPGRVFRRAAPR